MRSFVLTLPSVPYLEAMLLLHAQPALHWNAARLAQRLYMQDEGQAGELVAQLRSRGICVEAGGGLAYRPATAELGRQIGQLAELYQQHLIEIANLIHTSR